jgi:hypothetical protein
VSKSALKNSTRFPIRAGQEEPKDQRISRYVDGFQLVLITCIGWPANNLYVRWDPVERAFTERYEDIERSI